MKRIGSDQHGIAHIGVMVFIIVVIVAVGFGAWRVMNKADTTRQASDTKDTIALNEAAKAECAKQNDKDLCKFLTSWKANQKYRMTSTDAKGASSIFEADGTKSHIKVTGEASYEVITIDKTIYTKAGSVWYKQTIKDPSQDVAKDYKNDFEEPETTNEQTEDKTTYKNLGKETCDKLTCFKYEVIDPQNAEEKQFIWFDTKDYQLRRSRTEGPDGVTEQKYEYANVTIAVPSPVKELGPNQYIMPGQTEPVTMPSAESSGQ